MSKLVWDKVGERLYETGVDHGVLYPIQTGGKYNKGVAWNGLSAVTESPSGAEPSPGVFAGQQSRKVFGLSYRTILGNDVDSDDYGYKLHLVYGCLASPSEKGYQTKNDSPEPIALSWEFSTTPVEITKVIEDKKLKPTAILTFDSTRVDPKNLAALEEILYGKDPTTDDGDDGVDPRLPLPDEVIEIMTKENP